ncbi:MAG: hypothetical protein EOP56_14185 [Sphingobacteriales bacterium]|nr:MAG: hypothetical protein EOP56_14185 [Sphingobacteriales bacterium]
MAQKHFWVSGNITLNKPVSAGTQQAMQTDGKMSVGGSVGLNKFLTDHITTGIVAGGFAYSLDRSAYRTKVDEVYDTSNYFLAYPIEDMTTTVHLALFSFELGYLSSLNKTNIHPYLRVNAGLAETTGILRVHRKKKNDNYSEIAEIEGFNTGILFPTLGLRFNIPVAKRIDISFGANTSYLKHRIVWDDKRTNIYKQKTEQRVFNGNHSLLVYQAEIGVQYHFNKKVDDISVKE